MGLRGCHPCRPTKHGVNDKNDNGRARRTRRAPRALPTDADAAAAIHTAEIPVFVCESCAFSCPTKIGLGVHIRRKHPEVANAAINIERQKAHWTDEEVRMMAHNEARLVMQGTRFINQALVPLHPARTLEGIKGKRRAPAYKRLVEELVQGMIGEDQDSPPLDDEMLQGRSDAATLHPRSDTRVGSPGLATSKPPNDMQEVEDRLMEHFGVLPSSTGPFAEIDEVIASLNSSSREVVLTRTEAILRRVRYPPAQATSMPRGRGKRRANDKSDIISRRKRRRAEYARVQTGYRKNRSRQVKSTLSGDKGEFKVTRDFAENFWSRLLTRPAEPLPELKIPAASEKPSVPLLSVWGPITYDEIRKSYPRNSSAAGPDKITPRMLRALPWEFTTKVLNFFLWCGRLPEAMLSARTVFISKKKTPTSPGDLRPITISNNGPFCNSSTLQTSVNKIPCSRSPFSLLPPLFFV